MCGARAVLTISLLVLVTLEALIESCPTSEWASLMSFKAALNEPNFGIFHSWRGTNFC